MIYLEILLIGIFTGTLCGAFMLVLTEVEKAEQYPLGGFIPGVLVTLGLGTDNVILSVGALFLGGLTGYYLALTVWKGLPKRQRILPKKTTTPAPTEAPKTGNLADYL